MIHVHTKVACSTPFPGLRSFGQDDSFLFFGHDNPIRDPKEKLTDSQLLAIIDSSCSGKSSLVKAGLIPQLIDDQLGSSSARKWEVAFFNPEATPILNLARALYQTLNKQNRTFADRFLPGQTETLLLTYPRRVWGCGERPLLFSIDQLETPNLGETRNGVG